LASNHQQDEQRLALFIDFENIAIGVRDAHYRKFDVNLVLERLLDKGKLLVKRAYADWSRYSDYKRAFHEAAIELVEVPQKSIGGKNSADIRMVVDAMDMSFQKEHINCFVVASGDSDFSPLVSKLKENNKYVIGLGVKNSTSDLLMENCDEFIFYEDLVRGQEQPLPVIANVQGKLQECFSLLADAVLALQRENKEVLWGSMVKETMKRKKPSFNESYYGFRTFSQLLEDAQRRGIVQLRRDQKSGSYVVEDLGTSVGLLPTAVAASRPEPAPRAAEPAPAKPEPAAAAAAEGEGNGPRTRRRRSRGRGRGKAAAGAPAEAGAPMGEGEAADADEHDHEQEHEHDEGDEEAASPEPTLPEAAADPSGHGHDHEPSYDAASPQEPPVARPDRPFLSLFSWVRRDPRPEDDREE
jgi:uncharacterized protein (TIGR00288 family)